LVISRCGWFCVFHPALLILTGGNAREHQRIGVDKLLERTAETVGTKMLGKLSLASYI
jgi:hypothetical protein